MNISESIRQVRDEFVRDGLASSYYDINNGHCEDLALEAMRRTTSGKEFLLDVQAESFMDVENELWDFALLREHWNFELPEGLAEEDLNRISFGNHVWVADHSQKKFYDAECPDGVDNFFDLPLFRCYIVIYLREKGISTPEVVTEDLLPHPPCPVPNPIYSAPGPGY